MQAQLEHAVVGTPHQGPKVSTEYLEGIVQAGQTLIQHHLDWVAKSGISEKSAVCRAHRDWANLVHDMLCRDELNLSALVCGETAVRKLCQIEMAVRRNPKQPDFEGLELYTSQVLDETGAVAATGFTNWMSQRQRDEAQILKQGRLLREERAAEGKRSKKGGGGGGGGGGKGADAADA